MKEKQPFCKKKWVWILAIVLILVILLFIWGSQPAYEEYKTDARNVTWLELVDGEVSGTEKVTFSGSISKESSGNTLIVFDDDGVYYVKNNDEFDVEIGDNITVWGVYVGDESNTGFPIIDAKVIEKNDLIL